MNPGLSLRPAKVVWDLMRYGPTTFTTLRASVKPKSVGRILRITKDDSKSSFDAAMRLASSRAARRY